MKTYIGTKVISAIAMTRLAYNELRDWTLPADENGDDEGYLVEYKDGGTPNHPNYEGYISWSPKEQFEKAYRVTDGMSFGLAIEAVKFGHKVARAGWNGKGMWLAFMPGGDSTLPDGSEFNSRPFIIMKTVNDELVPWVASQSDILADDWAIV